MLWSYQSIYRWAWKLRLLSYPLTTYAFRQRLNERMLARACRSGGEKPQSGARGDYPPGLNIFGYTQAHSGVGRASRLSICAAQTADIPFSVIDVSDQCISRSGEEFGHSGGTGQTYDINLFHVNADQLPVLAARLGTGIFKDRYNIGYWFWELPEFPDEWLPSLNYLDEVWVASSFCQKAIAEKSPIPVVVVPPGIFMDEPVDAGRDSLGLPDEGFVFLVMADGLSHLERKNPQHNVSARGCLATALWKTSIDPTSFWRQQDMVT